MADRATGTARAAREVTMTEDQKRFAARAVRRKRVFLGLSIAGVVIAIALTAYYVWQAWGDADYPVGTRAVLVILILLNARQNLRQYRFAAILERTAAPSISTG
jgi:hypothetical protein